jgi:hypothetical protein
VPLIPAPDSKRGPVVHDDDSGDADGTVAGAEDGSLPEPQLLSHQRLPHSGLSDVAGIGIAVDAIASSGEGV